MDTLSPESQTQQNQISEKPKRKYLRFALGFLGIIVVVGGGFFVWERYLSPAAKSNRETQKNYEKYLAWEKNYEKALTEDVYGGKTPEETLQMFIEALKKEDIDLASKYFALRGDGSIDPKWKEGLKKIKESGKLGKFISKLSLIKLTFKDDDGALFKLYDSSGEIDILVEIKLNKQSNVWKIESL